MAARPLLRQFRAICRGPSVWAIVGANGTVITSPSTLAWSLRSSGTANNLTGVSYGNGTYVAVGAGGTVISSADGTTWDVQYSGTTTNLNGVRFVNGRFLAVGAGGTILSSTNGSDWQALISGVTGPLNAVAFGNGRYLLAGADNLLLASTNGLAWENITGKVPTSVALSAVSFLDGSFWLCGGNGAILQSDSADGLPRLAGARLPDNAGYQVKVTLNVPTPCRVQVTTNLAGHSWQDVGLITNPVAPVVWTDAAPPGAPLRLYRVVSP